jgi:hypothetical protein
LQDVISMLKAYEHIDVGTLTFGENDFKLKMGHSQSVISFTYSSEKKGTDMRQLIRKCNPAVAVRIGGVDLLQKIKAMDTAETPVCTMELHDYAVGCNRTVALSLKSETERWTLIDGFETKIKVTGPLQKIDFRDTVTSSKKAPPARPVDEGDEQQDMDVVLNGAEAAAAAARPPKGGRAPSASTQMLGALATQYKTKADAGTIKWGTPMKLQGTVLPEAYTLMMHKLFAGKQLLALFKDIATDIQGQGLTMLFDVRQGPAPIMLATPLSIGEDMWLGIHTMTCNSEDPG